MSKYFFKDIVVGDEGLLKGPFGSDLKKSLYVPKGKDTYKVYLQENILKEDNSVGEHYISKEYFDNKMSRYEVKENDFIVTCDGTLGEIYQLKNINEKGIISSSLLRITLNNKIVDDNYFYYLFKAIIKKALITQGNNSVLKHLPGINVIRNYVIELPSLDIQRKIGNTLYVIDNKVKNNNKTIIELESMSKTIYDYWFLQYEFPNEEGKPYKSSGGKMVYNEELKKEIPVGWEITNIGSITNCHDSERIPMSNKERENIKGNIPYYGATGIMGYVNKPIFNGDYVLMAEDGSVMDSNGNPILQRITGETWVNNHAHVLEPINDYSCKLLMMILKDIPVAKIKTGSIQMKINQDNMNRYKIVQIPIQIRKQICKKLDVIDEKIIKIEQENQELTKLRDELLPLLMNGQVSFKS